MMRHLLQLLFLAVPLCLSAQRKQVVIHREGRSPLRIDLASIDSLTIEDEVATPHEYADLGLSVLWATCNIGAETPEAFGSYFAWAETAPKSSYTEDNYVYRQDGGSGILPPDISSSTYDAASVLWQGEWRMPTIAEVEELAARCTWTWTTLGNVNGYRIKGPSGSSIFLPACGQWRDEPINVGSTGYYWTSTSSEEYPSAAYNLNFTGYNGRWSANRAFGFCIRPVCTK